MPKANSATTSLTGKWLSDPHDLEAIENFGAMTLEFTMDGRLIYTSIDEGDGQKQTMIAQYELKNGVIITRSKQSQDETPYQLLPDGRLELKRGKTRTFFVRS